MTSPYPVKSSCCTILLCYVTILSLRITAVSVQVKRTAIPDIAASAENRTIDGGIIPEAPWRGVGRDRREMVYVL